MTRTDGQAMQQLAPLLEGAEEIAPTDCPFGSVLWLTRTNEEKLAVCPAEDGCGVFWSGEKYYRFGSDGAALWDLFEASTGLPGLKEGDACQLSLEQLKKSSHGQERQKAGTVESPWDVANAQPFFQPLNAITWEQTESQWTETRLSYGEIMLELPVGRSAGSVRLDTEGWTLTAYEGMDAVLWKDYGYSYRIRWLRPVAAQEGEQLAYHLLRAWYDEAEFAALWEEIVIPNRGQSPEEAAQAWRQKEAEQSLKVSKGSLFRVSFVKALVTGRDAQTSDGGYESGKQWHFLLELIFVPDNRRALDYQMAGNTTAYTGDDPEVPEGAYACTRMGYVVLEPDGWHGEITGTG